MPTDSMDPINPAGGQEAKQMNPILKRVIQAGALALILAVAALAISLTVAKENKVPEAPDMSKEQKIAEELVKTYEDAVRKPDAKKAWDTLSEGRKSGSQRSMFEDAVKALPNTFRKYKIEKKTERLVNTSFAKEYKMLEKPMLDGSWAITTTYPNVETDSPDATKTFVVIPEKGQFKIYDIR